MTEESRRRIEEFGKKLRKPTPEEAATREERSAAAMPGLLSMVERIAGGDSDLYELAKNLYRESMAAYGPGGPYGARAAVLWNVWTEFDDVASYLGIRTPEVEDAMRTAAREWLTIQDADEAAWRAYREKWLGAIESLIRVHRLD